MMRFPFQNALAKKITLAGLVFFLGTIPFSSLLAAPRKGFEAQLQKTPMSLVLSPGETRVVEFAFKNVGTSAWANAGTGHVSLYTANAKERKSIFATPEWLSASRPALLKEVSVAKNGIGRVSFTLRAPEKAGTYKESFALAAEDITWIPGGEFTLQIEVKSAARKGYEAYLLKQPEPLTLTPGETKSVELTYKNIGKTTWKNTGTNYVSLYGYDKKEQKSAFASAGWLSASHPVALKEKSVAPGATGTFVFTLTAPQKAGAYTESFHVAAENSTWIPGAPVSLRIQVVSAAAPVAQAPVEPTTKTGLGAFVLLRSAKQVVAEGGEQIVFKVGIKNTGTIAWKTREIRSLDTLGIAAVGSTKPVQLALNETGTIEPGAMDFLSFSFQVPTLKGTYALKYAFAANGTVLPDAEFTIPVEVTADSGDLLQSPVVNQIQPNNIIPEPMLRIGVLIVDGETNNEVRISCNTAWSLMDGNGTLISEHPQNTSVTASYKDGRYFYTRAGVTESTTSYLRFVPKQEGAVCKIENFDKRVTRRAGFAENTFRNSLELRYNSGKNRTWVINEVKMEEYLAGLGETSELSNYEFKKTLMIIARTFALYQWERATKHASEFFHMNSSADDQVYRGYEYEMNNPSIGVAARETRGITVTYEGRTAITPYFSRSDGRTRDWHEVWGGTVAWAKSVPTPCDAANNRTLWGHGVGLSASEALCMAKNGKKWDEILHYFYTDIDLTQRWY